MKFNFNNIKEKLFSKKENNQTINKSNIILLSILIVGIILAIAIYIFTKNLIYSVICLIIDLILITGFKIYTNSKSKVKDDEVEIKIEFINRLVENLIAKQNPTDSIYNSINEVKSSVFKDTILNNYVEQESKFNKIEIENSQFYDYDIELINNINNLIDKKYNISSTVNNLIEIKNKLEENKTKFSFEMCQNLILGVMSVFYIYYIISMIFS